MSMFKRLGGDIDFLDYGGTWLRNIDKGRYHVIELMNWENAVGSDAEGGPTYNVSLSEVDTLDTGGSTIKRALEGWSYIPEDGDLPLVQALHDHGAKAPLGQWDGNNYKELMKEARALSHMLDDAQIYNKHMTRPVNKIGSTAREMRLSDFNPAMERGVRAGDSSAFLMAKIHGHSNETIKSVADSQPQLSMTVGIDHGFIQRQGISDDPIAYSAGFMNGLSGHILDQHGSSRDELADAFIFGHQLGLDVKTGDAPKPDWVK